VRSFASTDSVPASQATSYAAFRNSSRNNRAASMRQGAIADRPRQEAITDRPRRGSAPVVRASEAGPIALGARAGELWEVAEPLPHLGHEAFAPDGDGMDTSEFSGTYVIQQNVAVDIDQTFNQQNNVQFVNVDATTNQFAQVQIGVDPAVALELQHRAAMAEQDARQVRINFDAQAQQAEATHAAVVGNLVQEGRQAVAAAQDEAVHARSQAASSDASLNATLVMARTFEQQVQQEAHEAVARGSEESQSAKQRIAELERQLVQSQSDNMVLQGLSKASQEGFQPAERSRRPPKPKQDGAEHFRVHTPPRSRGPAPSSNQPMSAEASPSNRSAASEQSPGADSYHEVVEALSGRQFQMEHR
jgi:hypothetical protein